MAKPHFVAKNPQIFGKTNRRTRRTIQRMLPNIHTIIEPSFEKSRIGKKTQNAILKSIEYTKPDAYEYHNLAEIIRTPFYKLLKARGVANRKKVTQVVKRHASLNPDDSIRSAAIEYLEKLNTPSAKRALKKAMFDSERWVRNEALQAIVKKEGYLSAIKEIHRIFPINSLPIDKYFFHNQNSPELNLSKTSFIGHYRGAPVIITTKESHHIMDIGKQIPSMGLYKDGKIILNGNEAILPKEFRQIVIAHEFGEYWEHELGLATMLLEAKRSGKLTKFWNFVKNKPFDFVKEQQLQKLIAEHPKDFKGFEKYIK